MHKAVDKKTQSLVKTTLLSSSIAIVYDVDGMGAAKKVTTITISAPVNPIRYPTSPPIPGNNMSSPKLQIKSNFLFADNVAYCIDAPIKSNANGTAVSPINLIVECIASGMLKFKIEHIIPNNVDIISGLFIRFLITTLMSVSPCLNNSNITTETILLIISNANVGNAIYELMSSPNRFASTGKLITTKLVLHMPVTIAPCVLLSLDIFFANGMAPIQKNKAIPAINAASSALFVPLNFAP